MRANNTNSSSNDAGMAALSISSGSASAPASGVHPLAQRPTAVTVDTSASSSSHHAHARALSQQPPPIPGSIAVGAAGAAGAAGSSTAASSPTAAAAAAAAIVRENELARQELSRVVKQGYLKKLGAKVKSWKSRFFRLTGYVLTYHESREQLNPVLGECHLVGTLVKPEPDTLFGMPYTFSVTQTQAQCRTYYMVAADREEMDEWLFLLKQRHSFSPGGLPLRLNPRVHISMNLNPDDQALRDIAVNALNTSYISTDAHRAEDSQSMVKGLVSKKKRRFVLDGFDLDLTYITNRIIAMGFPSDGTESLYRNDMADVQRFFNQRHEGHYKVYNLCSERKYEHKQFHNRVLEFPFDDHNCPAFEDLPFFCKDVADFLNEHEKNVACIHCKAGKGRTGLLISVFLLYCGEWATASEALRYYAFARTQNQKGVTIASQIRWVHYWEKYLSLSRDGVGMPKLEALALRRMVFSKKSPAFDLIVASCHGDAISSKDKDKDKFIKETKTKDGGLEIEILNDPATGLPHWTFLKDFQFEFFKGKLFGGKERVMSFWLHTQFLALEPNYYLKMEKMDIDKISKVKSAPDFTLELYFEPVTSGKKAAEASAATALLSMNPLLPSALADPLRSLPPDQAEMLSTALGMMLEGRTMTRFYLGDKTKELRDKVEKRDVFVQIKDATPITSPAPTPTERRYVLCWSVDLLGSGPSAAGANATKDQLAAAAALGEQTIDMADIASLLIGKQDAIWTRGVHTKQAVEDRCFSIVTQARAGQPAVELHLEAYSERQVSLWVEGFKWLLERCCARNGVSLKEEEGELFAPNMFAPVQTAPAASHNRGMSSSNTPSSPTGQVRNATLDKETMAAAAAAAAPSTSPVGQGVLSGSPEIGSPYTEEEDDAFEMVLVGRQGRAESFARPPPIRVPKNQRRRVISVLGPVTE